jgi:hypothetical protein
MSLSPTADMAAAAAKTGDCREFHRMCEYSSATLPIARH